MVVNWYYINIEWMNNYSAQLKLVFQFHEIFDQEVETWCNDSAGHETVNTSVGAINDALDVLVENQTAFPFNPSLKSI